MAARVVGADHQHHDLGADAVQLPVFDPPQHVLRGVAADAEVGRVILSVELLPDLRRPPQPSVIESPRNSTPIGPALARWRNDSCFLRNAPLSFFGAGVEASVRAALAAVCARAAVDSMLTRTTTNASFINLMLCSSVVSGILG